MTQGGLQGAAEIPQRIHSVEKQSLKETFYLKIFHKDHNLGYRDGQSNEILWLVFLKVSDHARLFKSLFETPINKSIYIWELQNQGCLTFDA